jgi:hypothetical protein
VSNGRELGKLTGQIIIGIGNPRHPRTGMMASLSHTGEPEGVENVHDYSDQKVEQGTDIEHHIHYLYQRFFKRGHNDSSIYFD